jgi:hypothetical protein
MLSCYRTISAVLENGCDCNELVAFDFRNAPDLDRVLAQHPAPLLFRRKHPNYDRRRTALIAAERNPDASETNALMKGAMAHDPSFGPVRRKTSRQRRLADQRRSQGTAQNGPQ